MPNLSGIKVALISLGCDKNRVDSEVMLGLLAGQDCAFTPQLDKAQAIIINTCGFLQEVIDESRELILEAVEHKINGQCRAIIVTGCAAHRYKKELFDEINHIDAILGVKEYHLVADVMQKAFEEGATRYVDYNADCKPDENLHHNRIISTPGQYAYLRIAEGCDKNCTYCTIPKIRGPYKSRTIDSLMQEATILAQKGIKEIVLIAQDTTLYGTDIYSAQKLHELLQKLSQIEGITWLRLLYCYPEHIYDDLINEIAHNPKIAPYIDMPIQHASDKILKLMGRGITQDRLRGIIAGLRERIPNITLRTTLIAGFPGETKEDFKELCNFISDIKFDHLGVFSYSREEGTPAYSLPNQLEEKTKTARKDRLMKIQQEISQSKLEDKVGSIIQVMAQGKQVTLMQAMAQGGQDFLQFGRAMCFAPEIDGLVYFKTATAITPDQKTTTTITPGQIINVKITKSTQYDLYGEVQ